jgi:N-carbamoylputrescine amidase
MGLLVSLDSSVATASGYPFGTLIHKASHDKEEVAVVEIDTEKTDFFRTHWPFLRDRRIDSYQPITQRFIDEEQ